MPISKRRKKKGKPVGKGRRFSPEALDDRPVGVSLQDLINTVAYQEYVEQGKIAPNAEINIPSELPVMAGEGEDRRQVGTATTIPGDEGVLNINITDPEFVTVVKDGHANYSIDTNSEGETA